MVNFPQLDTPALASLVDEYPWFSAARAALYLKRVEQSGQDAAVEALREVKMYFPDAEYLAGRINECRPQDDFSDAELSQIIRSTITEKPKIIIAGMDFFSKDDYDAVRNDSDASISSIATVNPSDPTTIARSEIQPTECDMVTETLAQIYLDQGYPDEAAVIYRKLSLQSPEKSAYFASLIDKLKS